MRIEQAVIDEVLARTDLAAFIGSYVALKKRGRDLVGLCPFHGEKTPSFHVHPDRGFFKCFGCGVAGTAISFLMKLENLPFPEAVRVLAKRAGVTVEAEDPQAARARSEREAIYEANRIAANFFHRLLRDDPRAESARAYCRKRGLDDATIERFTLGFAPDSWDALRDELQRNNVELRIAIAAGLLKEGHRSPYDAFRGRLIVPTYATTGEVIAFGGRALGDEEPKYLNTSTTPVYTKGRFLYGLNLARRAIVDGSLVVVEGYLDCIALQQNGVGNTVAALGTAFTLEQAKELRKYAEIAYLCFDGDAAGRNATAKSVDVLIEAGVIPRIVSLPSGEDADSFVRTAGLEAFRALLTSAVSAVQFKLDLEIARVRAGTSESVDTVREAEKMVRAIAPQVEWDRWRAYVSGELGLSLNDLRNSRLLADTSHFFREFTARSRATVPKIVPPSATAYERDVLGVFVDDPGLVRAFKDRLPPERFADPDVRRVYATMCEAVDRLASSADVNALFADDPDALELLVAVQSGERATAARFNDQAARREYLERVVRKLEADETKRRYEELDREMDALVEAGMRVPPDLRAEHQQLAARLFGAAKLNA